MRLCGITHDDAGLQVKPLQRLVNPLAADRIHVQRSHLAIGEFKQMGGFATWCSAGIEDRELPASCRQAIEQQGRCQLCSAILNRGHTLGEARDFLHRQGGSQRHATSARKHGFDPRICKDSHEVGRAGFFCIDTQGHRRLPIVGGQNFLPMTGIVFFDTGNPPCRVIPLGDRALVACQYQCVAFAHKTPQAGVDEVGLGTGFRRAFCRLHGLIYHRENFVGCSFIAPGQRQCSAQQGIGCRRGRTPRKVLPQCLSPSP